MITSEYQILQLVGDFNRLHPEKENLFFDRLEVIRNNLIQRLQNCNAIKDISDKAYVHLLPSLLIREYYIQICIIILNLLNVSS